MDSSRTLCLHSTLCAPYSNILASTETPVPKYKDWLTLSAGSSYMLFFHPKLPQLWQHKVPWLHIKSTDIQTTISFSTRPNMKLYQGCQLLPTWPCFFSSAGSHQSLFWQLCFWYLYFHGILITFRFIFHVSPLLACPWPRAAVLFYNVAPSYWL